MNVAAIGRTGRGLLQTAIVVCLVLLSRLVPANDLPPPQGKPPNVLIILADDMGYSDLGCYGGEARTPNLDRLAKNGLRFSQFYNTTRCWPTRAAILTGYYAQQVRRDVLPGQRGSGTEGTRPAWAKLLPELLRPYGYRSYHSGKWHVDGKPGMSGFDRSYWLEDTDRFFSPKVHYLDDVPLPSVEPHSGYYATTRIAQDAIYSLRDHAANYKDRPFFSYLAFTSPHFPLHALSQDIAHYQTRFKDGWDRMREQRHARMKKQGIVTGELSSRTPGVPAWKEATSEEKAAWQTRMSVHAAMVDRMDREIGRVVDQLREMGELENTAIFFLSDNGASAEKLVRGDGNSPDAPPGSARTFLCLEPAGANLANTPLRLSKMFVHEGGISTSFIAHWPRGIKARGEVRHVPGHVIDLAPTILEIAGTPRPGSVGGVVAPRPPGRSLVPAFARSGTISRESLWWAHAGNRAIRVGDWKLVSRGQREWELYDLAIDRAEMRDLAAQRPDLVREMSETWSRLAEEYRRDAADPKAVSSP